MKILGIRLFVFAFIVGYTVPASKLFSHPVHSPAGTITGPINVCQGSAGSVYTVTGSSATTGYVWTVPVGATITAGSGTKSITVSFAANATGSGALFSVSGNGLSAALSISILVKPTALPIINGPASVNAGQTGVVYTVSNVTDVFTGFVWVPPTNATIVSSTSSSATVNFSASYTGTQGGLMFYVINGVCGTGPIATKNIPLAVMPSAPGTISGLINVIPGTTGVVYSVPPITNATSYQWSVPAGITITSGSTTNTIWVNFDGSFSGGSITVRGINGSFNGPVSAPLQIIAASPVATDMNYVRTIVVNVAGKTVSSQVENSTVTEASAVFTFFDGLGRPIQTVAKQASPLLNDIVQPLMYDAYGRQSRKYLPVTFGSDGWFKQITLDVNGNYTGLAGNTYGNNATGKIAQDTRPFSETVFEPSPLNRPVKSYGTGSSWAPAPGNDKFVSSQYKVNSHGTGASQTQEKVIAWKIDASGLPIRETALTGFIETGGYYSTGQLYSNVTLDEQGNAVREYANKLGQVVLKKVQVAASTTNLNSTTDWALTYYIYDELGDLRYVFQPELSKALHNAADTYAVTQAELNNISFQYKYDARKRMIEKQVPGADPVYMVYDSRDRLVMTQDGNQRKDASGTITKKEWLYIKYDAFNRPILTGVYMHGTVVNQAAMSGLISTTLFFETYNGIAATHGYTNTVFPTTGTLLTATYYDNYSFKSLASGLNYVNTDYTGQPSTETLAVKGQMTGSKTNTLGSSTYLYGAVYYDDRYRALQSITQNHKGGTDRVTSKFDFTGKVMESKRSYLISGLTRTIKETFTYDHAGRLLTVKHSTNGAADVMIVKNNYNELGQLIDKSLHSTDNGVSFKQSLDYRYNIRGWLTAMNNARLNVDSNNDDSNDVFGFELGYNTDLGLGATAQYNGNIAALKWSNNTTESNVIQRGYAFSYDRMNRLNAANQKQSIVFDTWLSGNYNENGITYDLNGNITTLSRTGDNASALDNLQYFYGATGGNRLVSVTDNSDRTKGFTETNITQDDYEYDFNGNLKLDKNKGITAITYNYLNLPVQVNKGPTNYIIYTYNANGKKLTQQVFGTGAKTTDYFPEMVFENNTLTFISLSEGRVLPDGANWEYQYHVKDHLGNVRTTFSAKEITRLKTATLETANATAEQAEFIRFAEARKIQSYLFDHTNASSPSTTTGYAQRLSGSANEKFGLAKSLSVMPGDVVNAEVYAKYIDPVNTNWTTALNTLITQIAQNTAPSGVVIDGVNYSGSTSSFPFPAQASQNTSGSSEAGPKAYLNWLVFKRDGTFLSGQSGYDRISTVPKEIGQDVAHERLYSPSITITEPGFVYIYLSNEEGIPLEVYFDDFKVTHIIKTPVIQSDDYYAFGMTFNPYRRESSVKNNQLYNGKELQDELDLGWMDYGARMYMPEIGRWGVIDNKADKYSSFSPYTYCLNQPTIFIDPDGEDVYLVIWYSANGEIGHAGIATDNYKSVEKKDSKGKTIRDKNGNPVMEQVADGTVTYFDFWPAGSAGKDNHDQKIAGTLQMKKNVNLSDLLNKDIGIGENRAAEGVIRLTADENATKQIESDNTAKYNAAHPQYCGDTNNCSDFAKQSVTKVPGFSGVSGTENIKHPGNWVVPKIDINSTTPNFLFRDTKKLIEANPALGKVLKQNVAASKTDFINGSSNNLVSDVTPGQ